MFDVDHLPLRVLVLGCAFFFSALAGAVAQRTRFCTMGAVADIHAAGSWGRMRTWAATVAVAMLGFNAMVGLGWVDARQSIYAGPQLMWLSALVGGGMFGFGMVMASGCGTRNLVRLGGGDLRALMVLLVLGLSAAMTLRGVTAVIRVATVERVFVALPAGQDLPHLLAGATGLAPRVWAPMLALALAGALIAWVVRLPEGRTRGVWVAALGFGGAVVGLWWTSGVLGHVAEDPETLEEVFVGTLSHRMEALTMVAPLADALNWLMFFSDRTRVLTFGIVNAFGVFCGACVMALLRREFRWSGFSGAQDTARHLVGAVLMGVGGTVALGCTVGQGVSGVSTLSLGSALAALACIGGAVLGLNYLMRRI